PVVLTAWAAVAVCTVVRDITGQSPRIKWPNDVLVHRKKLCGILIEQRTCGDGRLATVVGVGLNVQQPPAWFQDAGLPEGGSLACLLEPAPDTDNVAYRLIHA